MILMIGLPIYLSMSGFLETVDELTEGEKALDFCSDKCEDYDVLSSNNNSEYNFIRCECLIEIKIDAHPVSGASARIKTKILYFNSYNLSEISEKELIEIIKQNK